MGSMETRMLKVEDAVVKFSEVNGANAVHIDNLTKSIHELVTELAASNRNNEERNKQSDERNRNNAEMIKTIDRRLGDLEEDFKEAFNTRIGAIEKKFGSLNKYVKGFVWSVAISIITYSLFAYGVDIELLKALLTFVK